jgi:hypothetical protein
MRDLPIVAFREEGQVYLQSCECLLDAAAISPPFSQDDVRMIGYYVAEVQNLLAVSTQGKDHLLSKLFLTAPIGIV